MQCMHTTLKTRFCWRYSRLHLPTIWLKTFESLLGGIVGAGTFFGWSSHLRLGFSSRGYILGCSQHLALRLQIGNCKLKRWWFLVSHGGPNRLSWGSDDVLCLTGLPTDPLWEVLIFGVTDKTGQWSGSDKNLFPPMSSGAGSAK